MPTKSKMSQAYRLQLVELKNGETFNGHMVACDNFMNITIKDVYQTSADGVKFWKMAEAYVRGNNVRVAFVSSPLVSRSTHLSPFRSNMLG